MSDLHDHGFLPNRAGEAEHEKIHLKADLDALRAENARLIAEVTKLKKDCTEHGIDYARAMIRLAQVEAALSEWQKREI